MALCSLRLRRALSLSSSLLNHQRPFSSIPAIPTPPSLSSSILNPQNLSLDLAQPHHHFHAPFQSRSFKSSTISLSSRPRSWSDNRDTGGEDKMDPDAILFEGCDYNHWLITMDFPKDPKPTPEEMVETYVQTCAKVVGSVEEAKKLIYACSTTTYQGFQVQVSEEMSEQFRGLPGVVFILPDSYIDPINKEYGGDKYINGTIIPRPPPVQYVRNQGRYGDRNRDFNRPNRPRGSYQQGNAGYDNQGSLHGDSRNFGAQQNPPMQQNYGPPRAGERRDPMPINSAPGGRDNYQGDGRDSMPSYQANSNQGERGNYYPQGQRDFPPGDQRNYAPPEQRDNRNFGPPHGGGYGQGAVGTYGQGVGGPPQGGGNGQGAVGTYGQGVGGPPQGGGNGQGAGQGVGGPPQGGRYGQGVGGPPQGGGYGQGAGGTPQGGGYGQGAGGTPQSGGYGQGAGGTPQGGGYGQGAGGTPQGGGYGQRSGATSGQGVGAHPRGGGYVQGVGGTYGQGVGGPPLSGGYGQGASGTYGQGAGGTYGQGISGAHGQKMGSGFGQGYLEHGENQSFSQVEQLYNTQEQQRSSAVMGETGTGEGRC